MSVPAPRLRKNTHAASPLSCITGLLHQRLLPGGQGDARHELPGGERREKKRREKKRREKVSARGLGASRPAPALLPATASIVGRRPRPAVASSTSVEDGLRGSSQERESAAWLSSQPAPSVPSTSALPPLLSPFLSSSPPTLLPQTIEKKGVLSAVEKAGLLSKAEKAGLTLTFIEKSGLLSTAERLGLLEAAEGALVTDPGKIGMTVEGRGGRGGDGNGRERGVQPGARSPLTARSLSFSP